MDVRAVHAARREDVDPDRIELQLVALEVEFECLGERRDVAVEPSHEVGKNRRAPGQVVERRVGGVARIAVLLRPALPGAVVLGDRAAGGVELGDEPAVLELGAVDSRREESFQRCHGRVQCRRGVLQTERTKFMSYSITSSARSRRLARTLSPSALAALPLMTNSNLLGCSTGRSAGFAPLNILST